MEKLMTRLIKLDGGFIRNEYFLEPLKGKTLELKAKQCELGGIHIYIDDEFYDCIDKSHHWEWNKDLQQRQVVPNIIQRGKNES